MRVNGVNVCHLNASFFGRVCCFQYVLYSTDETLFTRMQAVSHSKSSPGQPGSSSIKNFLSSGSQMYETISNSGLKDTRRNSPGSKNNESGAITFFCLTQLLSRTVLLVCYSSLFARECCSGGVSNKLLRISSNQLRLFRSNCSDVLFLFRPFSGLCIVLLLSLVL